MSKKRETRQEEGEIARSVPKLDVTTIHWEKGGTYNSSRIVSLPEMQVKSTAARWECWALPELLALRVAGIKARAIELNSS